MSPISTILVSGWRSIPHSYAVVNQFQCLELLRRPGVRLFFEDRPYFQPTWQAAGGLFAPGQERAIAAIPPLPAGTTPDAELRIVYPYDLARPPRCGRTLVFGTAEFRTVPPSFIAGNVPVGEAVAGRDDVTIVTPSNWSRDGFVASGVPGDRVAVIPHGVDPSLFAPPTPAQRRAARGRLRLSDVHDESTDGNDFVFLNLGAMTGNKGIPTLLRAFAQVLAKHPGARLVLKGLDQLYSSKRWLSGEVGDLHPADAQRVLPRLSYIGERLGFADVASLYHLADCYVAPYLAEGFNLPALEAAASGLHVICTAGGPTDDFVTDAFSFRIPSTLTPAERAPGEATGFALVPSYEALVKSMLDAIENPQLRQRARSAGPAHVAAHFSWERVVDRLLSVMLPAEASRSPSEPV